MVLDSIDMNTHILDTIAEIPVEALPDTTLFFKRSGCYGECPVYSYLILENGHSYYTGVRHVDKLGKYQAILSDIALTSVDELAQGEQLWEKDAMYPSDINMWIMDLPTSTIILKKDGKRKIIAINHSAPEALMRFEKSLEAFIGRQDFEKVVSPN